MTKKKSLKIAGTSIWRLLSYFIIYSFLGYIIETLFALIYYNVLESRQSFLYGPFCSIYGVGAVFMYIVLNKYFKKNNHLLFFGGFLVGSVVEYLISVVGEMFLNVRWWDYSNKFLNINGRVCFLYSLFWGLLGVYFMKIINPRIDKLINFIKTRINIKILKIMVVAITIFLLVDCIISGVAIDLYLTRQSVENNLDIPNKEIITEKYNKIYSKTNNVKIINKFFNNNKMVITYPNLTITLKDKTTIKVRELLPEIQPYYYYLGKLKR